MGYYRGGDYYRGGGYYRAGGIFGTIGKALGTVARGAVGLVTGGPLGAARAVLSPGLASPTLSLPSGPGRGARPEPGLTGAVHRAIPGGASGFLKARRMNMGNAKAARRAVRRLKGVRHLLQSIEREMPHRPCHREHKAGRSRG